MTADELVVAVYLDTNVLLDLLATVEDGFTLVERVTSGQTRDRASEQGGSAEVGIPFHFFRLGLTGKLARSSKTGETATSESELTHTYGSLLHRLRRYLIEEHLVHTATSSVTCSVGDFVEFTGLVRPNPFTDSFTRLESMLRYIDVAMAMESTADPTSSPPATKGGRGQSQQRKKPANPETSQMKTMGTFIGHLTEDVEREGTSTVVVEAQSSGYRAVVTLFDDYLRDRSMAELLNREFRVLGKMARHLPAGSSEGVDLLASSGLGGFPPELLSTLSDAIAEMSRSGAARIAAPSTTIAPPVIEIVPIAIYL